MTSTFHRLRVGQTEYVLIGVPRPPLGDTALSPAEHEVARLAIRGLTTAQIAESRKTAKSTVVNQLCRIYRKLGVSGRAALRARYQADSAHS